MNVQRTNDTKDKVRELQIRLYLSAKKSSSRKYHALYDKIYRPDILMRAWEEVRKNRGSAGIDKETIVAIEEEIGIDKVLEEITGKLKDGKYIPQPVKRVEIPKGNGKKRPLGIPIVRDRIIQAAMKIVIEPIFEADFKENSYGFRPKKNAHQALEAIRKACNNKGIWVLDADIKGYFDSINHNKLMLLLERRINDKRVLKLIRKWLKAGIMEDGKYRESEIGSPQGGVISPLLANIYLDYLDTMWNKHFSKLGKLIRYADDFVVICKSYKAVKHAYKAIEKIMERLELTLSKEKTKVISLWNGKNGFDFLGYHNRMTKHKTAKGQEYYQLEKWLTNKAKRKIKYNICIYLSRDTLYLELEDMIEAMNKKIVGWRNYYGLSRWDKLVQIDKYIQLRFIIWFNQKRQRRKRQEYKKLCSLLNSMGLARIAA